MGQPGSDPGGGGLVPRLAAGLVAVAARRPWLVLSLTVLSLVASAWAALTRLEYRTRRDELIHPDKECQRRWRQYLSEFGEDEDMVVVVRGDVSARWPRDRGGSEARSARSGGRPPMVEALEDLAGRVRDRPALFDRLFYKVDLRSLCDRALLLLPADRVEAIRHDLERMRPLLDLPLAWQMFSLRGMLAEASGRLRALSPGEALDADNEGLFRQLTAIARTARLSLADPSAYRNPWSGLAAPGGASPEMLTEPQYFFSGDGALAFLLVRPAGAVGLLGPRQSVEAMRQIVAEVRRAHPEVEVGLTGLPVLELDEMLASQRDTGTASWLALAGVALLYLVVFRRPRLPLLTVSSLIVGTGWALGWLTLTVGHLNLLSATFAVMLIGMGDYGVLWVTRYQQERSAGADVDEALRRTARGVGPGIVTAAVTTGLAFYAAMLADFQAVAELGWIAGSGVLLCALACFTILPALIAVTDRRKAGAAVLPFAAPDRQAWLPGLARRPRAVLALGGLAVLALAVFALRVPYDHNLLNLQAPELESVAWEQTLLHHTTGAGWHALSYTDTAEQALARKAAFEKLPEVSRVVEVASLVPPDQEQKLLLLSDIRTRLMNLPARGKPIRHAPSSPSLLRRDADWLATGPTMRRLLAAPHAPVLDELRVELARLGDAVRRLPAECAAERLNAFEERLAGDLNEDLHRLRDVSTPAPIRLEELPVALRERHVGAGGKWLLRVFGKDSLWEYGPLAKFTEAVQTVDAEATGKPFTTLEGLRAMKHGFQWAGVYALAAIVVVLALDFRSLLHVLLALAPLAVGVVLALGVMGLCGLPLNPANMIALPLIVGVGVDNGVHVLHDYLSRRRAGEAYRLGRPTGQGILVAALTTMLGFGALMISTHRGLAGLGFILALGVGCCMCTALVLLPAALNLWSGRPEKPAQVPTETIPLRRAA